MARQYQKTNWQNTPSTATPLSADNLNHIEDGIYNLETKVENNASAVSDLQSGKVDKVTGKGLSTNDFTDTYKSIIETNQANVLTIFDRLETKVDKVTGKGLSTNDFTDNDVDKLRNDTYTKSETRGLVSKAYHPAGTIHVEDLTASILISANLNNVYNLDGDGTTSNLFIEGAGHPLKDGTNIGVINFGTDESPNILFDDLGGFIDLSGYATTSAMNTALAGKVDKVSGKGLSTNDFTDVYKSQIETNQGNILTLFDDKVDKEAGKGLSSNDFTSRYINAINDNTDNISDNTTAIQANANNITALQNNKVDKVVGKGLSTNDFTNNFKKGIAISQELAYDRATIPQPNLDADFHTVNGERTVIYQGNAYSFHTMTYNPISKKYVYGILCNPVYQGGLFFCEVDNPASDRHNWLDTTTFPTDILINGDIYTAVMPTGEAYYVSYSYNNNDEKELVYCNALDSSRLDYWIKTEIIINSIFNIGNYIFYVADNKVYKYEFAHGSVELDFDTVPFAYTYGGGRCIALTKNQYNVISAFMSYDGIEWTKVNFPSINKTNEPSGLIYDHGIFLFYQKEDEYVITSKDGFSWEKHKLSINVTEYRENYMIFDEIGWGGGIFYACGNSVDEGHYDDYTIWTSQDGYTWEQTVKYLEDEIDNKTDYYNGMYIISVAQNLYYPTYRLDGVYGKGDVYTKSESNSLVIANPTDEAEGTLNKLKVNGTTYNLPQGGETNVQADWTETDPTSSAYIQHKPNLGTAASKDVPTSGNATSTQVVMGNDTRLTNARPASDVSSWAKASTKPTYTASEVGAYTKTESDNKYVAKETGKGLSTNDYTTADKTKLAGISEGATQTVANPADTATETLSKVEIEGTVYDIPQGASGATELSELTDVNLTDVEDNDILQYDETANKWKNSNALQGSKTATGNPITVTDAAPVNAVNLSMDLEPVQDLHGYDYPWVGGAGKNKLPVTSSDETMAGIAYTKMLDNDGNVIGVKCVGTISGTSAKYLSTDVTLPAGTYILTGGNGVTSTGIRIVANYTEGGTLKYREATSEEGVTFTLSTETQVAFYLRGEQTNLAVNAIIYPMIRLSTETDHTFAPYSNISPITGQTEVVITDNGINQWDEQWEVGNIDNNGQNTSSSTDMRSKNYVKVFPDTAYYYKQNSSHTTRWFKVFYYDKNKTFISKSEQQGSTERTTPSNCYYVRFAIYGTFEDNNISINYPSTDTEYHAYKGKTYTIQIGQTVYGGQLDVTRGKMVVTHGYKDLGSLYFSRVTNATYGSYFYTTLSDGKKTSNDVGGDFGICSKYPVLAVHWNQLSDKQMTLGSSFSSGATCAVVIKDDSYTNEATFNTMLQNENVQLVYELAEPFTIDLTPTQIKMLENTNTLSSDGTMTLEYQTNNAIGEVLRAVEESYDPEFAVRPVLKKKAFSGTTDSDGSVTLINASDIPSNHRIIPLQITDMTIGGSAGTYFVEYRPYNSGDSVKGYCYTYYNGSQITPVGTVVTGNFYYYDLEG